jgi:hypothetical protein
LGGVYIQSNPSHAKCLLEFEPVCYPKAEAEKTFYSNYSSNQSASSAFSPLKPMGHLLMPPDVKALAKRLVAYAVSVATYLDGAHETSCIVISPPFDCVNILTIVRRSFDNDRIAVIFFLQTLDQTPSIFLRAITGGQSLVSMRGVHELCISREKPSRLKLTRWSRSEDQSKPWATLQFITWEGELRTPTTLNLG